MTVSNDIHTDYQLSAGRFTQGGLRRMDTMRLLMIAASELSRAQKHSLLLLRGAKERVVGFLLDMAERQNNWQQVDLPMTRGDIANYLGLTTETVSRMFGRLEDSAAIAIERRRVTLCDLPALKEMYK